MAGYEIEDDASIVEEGSHDEEDSQKISQKEELPAPKFRASMESDEKLATSVHTDRPRAAFYRRQVGSNDFKRLANILKGLRKPHREKRATAECHIVRIEPVLGSLDHVGSSISESGSDDYSFGEGAPIKAE